MAAAADQVVNVQEGSHLGQEVLKLALDDSVLILTRGPCAATTTVELQMERQ